MNSPGHTVGGASSSLAQDRVVRVFLGAGLAYIAIYMLLNAASAHTAALRIPLDLLSVGMFAAPVIALGAAVLRRQRQGRPIRTWAWFTASTLLTASGSALSIGHDDAPGNSGIVGVVANVLLVGSFVAAIAGFFTTLQPGARAGRFWMGVDLVLASAGVAALLGRVLLAGELSRVAAGVRVTTLVYAVGGIATVLLLLPLVFRAGRRMPASLQLVGAAYLVGAVTNCCLLRAAFTGHQYQEGSWLGCGYQIGLVLLTLGALIAARHNTPDAIHVPHRRDSSMPLSIAAAGAAVCGLIVMSVDLTGPRLPLFMAAAVVVGLLARTALLMRDRARLADQLAEALAEQQRLAVTDALTGLPNRRYFEHAMTTEIVRALRFGRPMSLVILDLDHFKTINDVHGHPAGDAVLSQVALVLRAVTRGSDVVARYGGEEFVWLLPETTEDEAAVMAERLRAALAAHSVYLPSGDALQITGSIGIAAGPLTATGLLTAADQALYRAKAAGRNRVVRASDAPPEAAQQPLPTARTLLAPVPSA